MGDNCGSYENRSYRLFIDQFRTGRLCLDQHSKMVALQRIRRWRSRIREVPVRVHKLLVARNDLHLLDIINMTGYY